MPTTYASAGAEFEARGSCVVSQERETNRFDDPTIEESRDGVTPGSPARAVSARLDVRSFGLTDPGMVRPRNEDQFLIAELCPLLRVHHSSVLEPGAHEGDVNGRLFVIADGIGGANAGDVASAMLIRGIESFVLTALIPLLNSHNAARDAVAAGFHAALRKIEHLLFAEANRNLERRGMGTTATVALTLNSHLLVTHVGDGRCYLLRDGQLLRLTRDHTLVQTMLDQGLIAPHQVSYNRFQHVLTNSVGGSSRGVVAESNRLRLQQGDRLLLCTDGLTRMVADEQILETLEAESDPFSACQCLVDLANAAGGRDNVTVVVAHFEANAAQ